MTVSLLTVLFLTLAVQTSVSIKVIESFPNASWDGKAEVGVDLKVRNDPPTEVTL